MYTAARDQLAEAGYEQYEVSNWARPGQESRHNLTYWRDGEWIGIGAGAASAYGGRRWKNTPVLERYIASVEQTGQSARVEDEQPDLAMQLLDCITLGLRLREGISLAGFRERFGVDLIDVLGETATWLLDGGILVVDGDRLRVAAEHQLILNEILVRLSEPLGAHARRETSASHSAAR
jgi:oxygen-independent coproporphyrinogen-3 oxidase